MADIFVSYSHADRSRVIPFVEILLRQNWSVWWDQSINPGDRFSSVIENEISQAKCVVVLWTASSIISDWVQAEASHGLEKKILIPVLLEDVSVPLVFRQTQAANLGGWPKSANSAEMEQLFQAISSAIAKPVLSVPKPKPRRNWPKWAALTVLLFAVVSAAHFFTGGNKLPITLGEDAPAVDRPIASIAVLPFRNMSSDITTEVVEALTRSPRLQASLHPDDLLPRKTGFNLQAAQVGNQLTVSLFAVEQQTTRLEFQLNLDRVTIFDASRIISQRVAREFGQKLALEQEQVPNELYVQYLEVRAGFRDSQTQPSLLKTIEQLESIMAAFPRFTEAQASLCSAYISLYARSSAVDDFEQAEKQCFRASRLSDTNPWVDIAIARLYASGGQLSQSESRFKRAMTHSPFLTEALRGLAEVQEEKGDGDTAEATLLRAQDIEPDNWRNYQALAAIYFNRGDFTNAVPQYEAALARAGAKPLLLNDLGAAYFMLDDIPAAIRNWQASIDIELNYSALSNLGSAYYFNRQFDKALKTYLRAVENNNQDYNLWLNAGEAAYHGKGDASEYYRQAISLAEARLEINPDDYEAMGGLALCYSSISNFEEANHYLDKALMGSADDIYMLYYIAVTYARLGDIPKRDHIIKKMVSKGYSKSLVDSDANFD